MKESYDNEADRAVRGEVRSCISKQGGTNSDNRMDELKSDTPGGTFREEQYGQAGQRDYYYTDGEYQLRRFPDDDNVTPPEDEFGICCL